MTSYSELCGGNRVFSANVNRTKRGLGIAPQHTIPQEDRHEPFELTRVIKAGAFRRDHNVSDKVARALEIMRMGRQTQQNLAAFGRVEEAAQ